MKGNIVVTARGPFDTDESARIDANTLPVEVRGLWETMLRLDPTWSIEEWMARRAREELKLIDADLVKERMRLQQRLSRVEALCERLKKQGVTLDEVKWSDPHQMNLFDIFGSADDTEEVEMEGDDAVEDYDEHPATALLDYLPGEAGDDPLLAIVAQLVLLTLEDADGRGELPLSLEDLGDTVEARGVSADEVIEALEWLLERQEVVEVEEDMFTLN